QEDRGSGALAARQARRRARGDAREGSALRLRQIRRLSARTRGEEAEMADAWIDGRAVALRAAAGEAAKLLKASRLPVVAGLGTDVDGARAAIGLAAQIGGVIDHSHSRTLLRDLDVARESGMMVTTPDEAGLHADTLLMVGPGLEAAWPELDALLRRRP